MKHPLSFWTIVVLTALVAGSLAGAVAAMWYVSPQFQALERNLRERVDRASSKTTPVEVVRVEREPAAPVIPSLFLQGRRSPTLLLVRRNLRADDQLLNEERIVGSASALTTDGWLLAPGRLFESLRLADVGVLWEGRVYPLVKAVRDTSSDLVYTKVALQNLPVASFVRSEDVVNGLPVWVETTPGRVSPQVIVDTHERLARGLISSERRTRRYVLNGQAATFAKGGIVWNATGELVGVLGESEGSSGAATVIPASSVASALTSLLATQEIRRPSLGIHGVNAAFLVMDAATSKPSRSGFLLRGDRLRGIVAVDPKGPAAKGLREGDVIERMDNDVIQDAADVAERLEQYRPGTVLPIHGTRAGVPFQLTVSLGEVITSELVK